MSALPTFARPAPAEVSSADIEREHRDEEERLCADVGLLTDWLSQECADESDRFMPLMPRDDVALQLVMDRADVPRLVALLMYERGDVASAAASEIRRRYLAQHREPTQAEVTHRLRAPKAGNGLMSLPAIRSFLEHSVLLTEACGKYRIGQMVNATEGDKTFMATVSFVGTRGDANGVWYALVPVCSDEVTDVVAETELVAV